MATAALTAEGYRATRESRHYRTIQSLAYTIGAGPNVITQLDHFRKKRNIGLTRSLTRFPIRKRMRRFFWREHFAETWSSGLERIIQH